MKSIRAQNLIKFSATEFSILNFFVSADFNSIDTINICSTPWTCRMKQAKAASELREMFIEKTERKIKAFYQSTPKIV